MVGTHTAGALLQLIRAGAAETRAELAAVAGLARSTVSQRVDLLLAHGLVVEGGEGVSQGGRPPTLLRFNRGAGVVLAADLGATRCRTAVCDLAGEPLAETASDLDIALGPDRVLPWLEERFLRLLDGIGRPPTDVRGIGVGLPGPVEFAAGRAVSPPIMPGWDGVAVPERLQQRLPGPVLVDNDVNIMALGEFTQVLRGRFRDVLFVKVGTGIGCGIIADGRIHRGAQGAAGDIGHIRTADHPDAVCRCGNRGCVEAVAGGGALAQHLSQLGVDAADGRDVVALARAGNDAAVRIVRDAGRLIGEVLAGVVNFFNPSVIVIGGDVARADEQLLAGIREIVYQRSTPLATRHLKIRRSRLADRAGIHGAAAMVLDEVLSADAVDGALERAAGVRA